MDWELDDPYNEESDHDCLPNGHRRQEYLDLGFSDMDIKYWGLDQPGAPDPHAAGFVIMDMLAEDDWDGDGEPDF